MHCLTIVKYDHPILGYRDTMREAVITAATSHNDPIPDTLKPTAHAMILEAETSIVQLGDKIARLGSHIAELKLQRSQATEKLRQCRSTLSSHRDIPNEILAQIFLHHKPRHIKIPWDRRNLLFTVSHVCRKWRLSVLRTPSLWRTIWLDVEDRNRHRIDMTKEVIRRGGNRHISMTAIAPGGYTEQFYQFIAANLVCFEHLYIRGSVYQLRPILSSPSGSTAELERLHFMSSGNIQDLLFLESASRIRELNIPMLVVSSRSLLRLSLSKITIIDLSLNPLTSDEVFTLLKQSPLVQRFTTGLMGGPRLGSHTQSTILVSLTLPGLESLVIGPTDPGPAFPEFLASLVMPRLCHLRIFKAVEWVKEFTLALSHSKDLEHLGLLDSSLSADDLDILLPAAPNIRYLELGDAVLSTQTLQGVARGALLSKVWALKFFCEVHTLGALDLHLDMLEQRFDHKSSKNLLKLRLLWDVDPDDPAPVIRRVHEMIAKGWGITVEGWDSTIDSDY